MKNNSQLKPLLRLMLPLAITGIAQSGAYFFENIFLAKLGPETLAAGGLVAWLLATLTVVIFGILSSLNILISLEFGAKNFSKISAILRDGLGLSIVLSIPLSFLVYHAGKIFSLLGQSPEIILLSNDYLHAAAWSLLPNTIMIVLIEFIIGIGHGKTTMFAWLFSVILNILTSYTLIFGKFGFPMLGIAGAGWGMTISYTLTSMTLALYILFQARYKQYLKHFTLTNLSQHTLALLQLGLPMGLMFSAEIAFFLVLNLMIGTYGYIQLSANQIVLQYASIFMQMFFTVAQALTVRMGHLIGENKLPFAYKTASLGIYLSAITMLIIATFLIFFPDFFIAADFDLNDPRNGRVIHYARSLLALSALFQIFEAVRITLFGALRALKDTRFTFIASLISFWGISFPVGYGLSHFEKLDALGYWWGMAIGASISVLILTLRLRKLRYQSFG